MIPIPEKWLVSTWYATLENTYTPRDLSKEKVCKYVILLDQ